MAHLNITGLNGLKCKLSYYLLYNNIGFVLTITAAVLALWAAAALFILYMSDTLSTSETLHAVLYNPITDAELLLRKG